ncbi:hypothetical protein BOX15_Mlig025470g1 [Macrostomum lignano]|uniref:EGF-like domain-containing protein n=2 Tax=Macrostomum lignano TaxID=282301 RepID=A0A267H8Z2_9PLAT|nr:hypothetical protein BOX15_Mlig025470g1 [Macrostomum lignano]
MTANSIALLLTLAMFHRGTGFPCLNGATYDAIYDRCECTPNYFGYRCETAFASYDPCQRQSELPVIEDLEGKHRPGAGRNSTSSSSMRQPASELFSTITPQWYRVQSPWGNRMVEGCSSGVKDSDCGGRAAYVLHDVVVEKKSKSRSLSRARAYRVWSQLKSCRLVDETFYPVRILKCAQSVTLYFLLPLPKTHSYCIGDEADPSENVLVPKKPILQLHNDYGDERFTCGVYGSQYKSRYTIRFVLTGRDGNQKSITPCTTKEYVIPSNCVGNCTFKCPWYEIAKPGENIYGSNIVCTVKPENLNVPEVSSNIHSFTFSINFTHGEHTIRPGKPVELCISTRNIPTTQKITFSVSVARKIRYRKDRTDIAVLSNDKNSNESVCEFASSNSRSRLQQKVCMKLVLYNQDNEGKFVFGLKKTEQLSEARINISYKSSADGIFTRNSNPNVPSLLAFERFESLHLKVDLRTLASGPQNYLHIFSDPFVKPVGGIYKENSTYVLRAKRGENDVYVAMRNKVLPYEVQVLITRPQSVVQDGPDESVVTRVAVRYNYITIIISGNANENNGELTYRVHCKALNDSKTLHEDTIRADSLCDVRRNGIKIDSTLDVVRIHFEFYGTIIYAWKFRAHLEAKSSCAHRFIMSWREMRNKACKGGVHPVGDRKEFALDVTVIPSMYDIPGNVDGLMYATSQSEAVKYIVKRPSENLFSTKYTHVARKAKSQDLIDQPFEIMKICHCENVEKQSAKSGCLVDVTKIKRTKREIPITARVEEKNHIPTAADPQVMNETFSSVKNKISSKEAQQFCSDFLSVQMVLRNYSLSLCSGHSDHQIGANYAAQFEFLCVRYALTLNTYQFAETLLNSMLDVCRKDIGYNASEVRSDSRVLKDLERDICPNDCSKNGLCVAGACECRHGFTGRGCENRTEQLEAIPTTISMPNQHFVCASENCSSALLLVSPMLKSTKADCLIRRIVPSAEEKPAKQSWKVAAVFATGSVMVCNLTDIHSWLKIENRLYAAIEISLESKTWKSNNSVNRLMVQSECSVRLAGCRSMQLAHRHVGLTCAQQPDDASVVPTDNKCHSDVSKTKNYKLKFLDVALIMTATVASISAILGRLLITRGSCEGHVKQLGKKLALFARKRVAASRQGRKDLHRQRRGKEPAEETLI